MENENKPRRIWRAVKDEDHPYFIMSRAVARDRELSWAARGVLAYLLSQRDDWEVRPSDLKQKCGGDKPYTLLRELRKAGYLQLVLERDGNRTKRYGYLLHETPLPPERRDVIKDRKVPANPDPEKPDLEKPDSKEELEARMNVEERNKGSQHTNATPGKLYERLSPGVYCGPYAPGHKFDHPTVLTDGATLPAGATIMPPVGGMFAAKSPKPAKAKKDKPDPAVTLAITERIEAYIKGLPAAPATNQYNHTTNRQAALDIFKAGFTPAQVTACTRDKSAEDFWRGKCIPLKTVANDIAAWQHAKSNGAGALPDWWPTDHYKRPITYDPPLTDTERAMLDQYHATVLYDQYHCREKWPQLIAAHLKMEAVK